MKAATHRYAGAKSIAQQRYDATAPGGFGSIAYAGLINDEVAWENFAVQVSVLDDLAEDGLIRIIRRHEEGATGDLNIDCVDFERIRELPQCAVQRYGQKKEGP